ncbi:MAG: UPF0175 family protein [bacterium]
MMNVVLEIPDDLLASLKVPPEETESRLRTELAIRLYQKGLLSFGKARQLCGMNKWEFHFLLGKEGILRNYDAEELQGDLATLEKLNCER